MSPEVAAAAIDSERFLGPVPGLPEVTVRRWHGLDDIPGMVAANQAMRDAAGIQGRVDLAMTRTQYSHLEHCDPATDLVVLQGPGEVVVGYGRVEWNDQTDGTRELGLVALTRPDWAGRGLERLLVAWGDARRLEIAPTIAGPDGPSLTLGAFTFDGEPTLAAELAAAGYHVADKAYEMVRPDLEAIARPADPEGVEIRRGRPAEVRAFWEAMVEAFRDHPGEIEDSESDYARFLETPRFDPTTWVVAADGDEIAGGILLDVDPGLPSPRTGYLTEVFVRRPWRRRGVARSMIAEGLVSLREIGADRALLSVSAANPHQAMTLYESAGFRIASSSSRWSRPIAPKES